MTKIFTPLKNQVFHIFDEWMQDAIKANPDNPNAMCLSTVSKNGKPSSRMVLLKDYGEDGFTFFSNSLSRKGQELDENPNVAICLYWREHQRQVRIEGTASKVSREITEKYFHGRARGSQIASHCSDQSRPLDDKQTYLNRIDKMTKEFEGIDVIPCREEWNGYIVKPTAIELWQEGEFRTHDRFVFTRDSIDDWVPQRLYP